MDQNSDFFLFCFSSFLFIKFSIRDMHNFNNKSYFLNKVNDKTNKMHKWKN